MDDKLRLLIEEHGGYVTRKEISVTVICINKSNCLKHIVLSL